MAVITLDKIIFRNNDSYLKMYKGSELIAEVESTPALDYLTFTGSGTIKFSRDGYTNVMYSKNGGSWSSLGSSGVSISTGDTVKLKANCTTAQTNSGTNSSAFTLTGTLYASGSLMSMIHGDNYLTNHNVPYSYQFKRFFYYQTALKTAPDLSDITTIDGKSNAFSSMFYGCTNLTTPPSKLKCTVTGSSSYLCYWMFTDCTSLTQTMDISDLVVNNSSANLYNLFTNMYIRCTGLTTIVGKLPRLSGAFPEHFHSMFSSCTSLTSIPSDLFENLGNLYTNGCQSMFYGCTGLTSIPNNLLSYVSTSAASCCYQMFYGCTGLTTVGNIFGNNQVCGNSSYNQMFYQCTNLREVTIPYIEQTADGAFNQMFYGCTSLNTVHCDLNPPIPYRSLTNWLYNVAASGTFYCKNDSPFYIDSVNGIPSGWTVVEDYEPSEFYIQPSTTAITLNDDTLLSDYIWDNYTNYEYKIGKTGTWKTFPNPAGETVNLVDWMALHPTYLVGLTPTSMSTVNFFSWNDSTGRYDSWPGQAATLLGATSSYNIFVRDIGVNVDGNMIMCNSGGSSQTSNINNIANIYALNKAPYWTGSGQSYQEVDISSISIHTSFTIAVNDRMYIKGDINDTAPSVNFAFDLGNVDFTVGGDVRSIIVADDYGTSATRPTGLSTANEVNCIVENEDISSTYIRDYYDDQYFKVYVYPPLQPLTFTALEGNSTITFNRSGVTSEYSTDNGTTWTNGDNVTVTLSNVGDKVMYRGVTSSISSTTNTTAFTLTGQIKASGNVNSMINNNPDDTSLNSIDNAFRYYFYNQSALKDISELVLSATTLTPSCYRYMFYGCSGITTIPNNFLPATTLAGACYQSMFSGCSSLTTIPANLLPATTLTDGCYSDMFNGCSSLTTIPNNFLPATTLAQSCYSDIFHGCRSLTTIPANLLPATTLTEGCYSSMFSGCIGLTTVPANLLPATSISAGYCYSSMFSGCIGLTTAPTLSATTLAATRCYQKMFYNCTNLNKVVIYARSIPYTNCLNNWLSNVSSTGDFYNLGGASYSSGVSGIPTGWTEHTSL